jgi:hypothetical protein
MQLFEFVEEGEVVDDTCQDHTIYLARKVPKMCLPPMHPLYEWSHECVYEYVATGDALYDTPLHYPMCEETHRTFVMDVQGKNVLDLFPQFNGVEIRPMSQYAVVCVVH